jgi:hypothetical protein
MSAASVSLLFFIGSTKIYRALSSLLVPWRPTNSCQFEKTFSHLTMTEGKGFLSSKMRRQD